MKYSAQKDGHADDLHGQLYTEIGFLHRELNPRPVTHFSTNRAWHRVTSLIETNALPLGQTATVCMYISHVIPA